MSSRPAELSSTFVLAHRLLLRSRIFDTAGSTLALEP